MTRIPDKEVEQMIRNIEEDFDKYYWGYRKQKALIEFPLGELMNPNIRGYIWAWHMKGIIKTGRITEKDIFKAHGIEGKASIPVDLFTALLAYKELPRFRRQIIKLKGEYELHESHIEEHRRAE